MRAYGTRHPAYFLQGNPQSLQNSSRFFCALRRMLFLRLSPLDIMKEGGDFQDFKISPLGSTYGQTQSIHALNVVPAVASVGLYFSFRDPSDFFEDIIGDLQPPTYSFRTLSHFYEVVMLINEATRPKHGTAGF
jgi:hypothetical protein